MRRDKVLKSTNDIVYVGRNPASAPACGLHHTHSEELKNLLNDAFK